MRASHALYTRVCVLCCCVQVSIPAWHSTLLSMLTVLCGRSAGVMIQGPIVSFEEEELLPVRLIACGGIVLLAQWLFVT